MSVINMVVGAATDSGATFAVKVTEGPVRIAVADNPGMSNPVFFGPAAVDARGVAKLNATGLANDTRYWWRVEDDGVIDTGTTGQFRTFPKLGDPACYRFGAASCAGSSTFHPIVGPVLQPVGGVSNHPVFDIMRQKALAEEWLFFCHLGDLFYYDLDQTGDGTLTNYRRAYDDVLLQPRQHALYNQVNWVYTWDNHDYSKGAADKFAPGRNNACLAYRERVPHYPLQAGTGPNPIYHAFQVARHLFIVADVYSEREVGETILGGDQKEWMDNLLGSTDAEFLVWFMGGQFIHPGTSANTWGAYPAERAEMIQLFGDHGFLDRMAIISGDRHSIGIDSGNPATSTLNPNGFPVFHCASMDSGGTTNDVGYDIAESPGRQRYGSFHMYDDGTHIAFSGVVWTRDRPFGWYSFGV